MEFAGKRWEGYEGFEAHQLVKRRFFDERHDTFEIHVTPGPDADPCPHRLSLGCKLSTGKQSAQQDDQDPDRA